MSKNKMDAESWTGMEDPFGAFLQLVDETLIPKIRRNDVVVSLFPSSGEPDAKFSVELGLALMMVKPIIAVVLPGSVMPAKLHAAMDEVVEHDWREQPKDLQTKLIEAMDRMAERGIL